VSYSWPGILVVEQFPGYVPEERTLQANMRIHRIQLDAHPVPEEAKGRREVEPFSELAGNLLWEEFQRQLEVDPARINLTDLWRAAGRRPSRSPRRWAPTSHFAEDVAFEGRSADGPAWAGRDVAYAYIQSLDPQIRLADGRAFMMALKAKAGRMIVSCPDEAKPPVAFFASVALAEDGDRTAAEKTMMSDVVDGTASLGIYAQETEVARVQRAMTKARAIRTARVVDGKLVEGR
jgi:hypothetical protein